MNDPGVEQLRAENTALRTRIAQLEAELERTREQNAGSPLPSPLLLDELPLRAVFDNAAIAIGIGSLDGASYAANPAMEQLLGYSEAELKHIDIYSVSHPDDAAKDLALLRQLVKGEIDKYQMDKRYYRRDGSLIYGKLTVSIIHVDGEPRYTIGMVEDITAQRLAAQAMEEAQRRFEMLANSLDVMFWLFDVASDREVYISPAYAKIWGGDNATILQQREILLRTLLPEDQPRFLGAMRQAMSGEPIDIEYRIVRADGAMRYIHGKGFPVFDAAGNVPYIAGTATDVTESRQATERIRQLNETLELRVQERTKALTDALLQLEQQRDFAQQITESMLEGVVVYNAAGIIEYANPFVSELTGLPLDQIIGARDRLAQLADDPKLVRAQMSSRRTGQDADYEVAIRGAGGEQKYIRILSTPRMQDGEYTGGIAVISDLTQRRQAEAILRTTSERLAQANRELARAARMKDEFLANVSHELRTPLTGILALSEALLTNTYGELAPKQVRPLSMIEESGRHLLSLINDVLDVAKAEAGKLDVMLEPVLASDICQTSLRLVQDLAVRKRLQVSISIEPPRLRLQADPRRLKQILVNLLSNAVKFTPEGGRIGLQVRTDASHKTITFTVWDEGIGIPTDRINQLFEPFVQLHSELSRSYAGTGLGLALVRRLAALHNGTVFVESEEQRGSRFHVVLPWAEADESGPATLPLADALAAAVVASPGGVHEPARGDATTAGATGRQPTILIAEDMAVTRTALQDFLKLQGFRVLLAGDGYETIQVVSSYKPDLVLMDIQMPGMDGLQAMRYIRDLKDPDVARVPIIVLTAHAMPGARERFLEAGADGYLSKPMRLAELLKSVNSFIPQYTQ
jgi:PAS domain S-box-containing protein